MYNVCSQCIPDWDARSKCLDLQIEQFATRVRTGKSSTRLQWAVEFVITCKCIYRQKRRQGW